jgi:hypothetical protein
MKKMFNEGNQLHNVMSSSGSGTVINYGSGSDFLTSYGSGSTGQKVTVPTVPVPVPQHCGKGSRFLIQKHLTVPVPVPVPLVKKLRFLRFRFRFRFHNTAEKEADF